MVDGKLNRSGARIGIIAAVGAVAFAAAVGSGPSAGPVAAARAGDEIPDGNKLVTPRVILEQTALVPGQTAYLGVEFRIEPQWHIYWRNNGDSGMPPAIEFTLGEGLSLGECQWPAPKRYLQPGDILDYIYEDRVTLIFPLTVGPEVKPGASVDVKAVIDWLVCKDMCVPGSAEVVTTLPVAATAEASADAPLFAAARKTHPRAASELGLTLATSWAERMLTLRVDGAEELTFFPHESDDGVTPVNILEAGTARSSSLALEYDEAADRAERVKGVLAVRKNGAVSHVQVDVAGPKAGGG